jgi:DNA invertase Pin-like site-specific DNA recombinase
MKKAIVYIRASTTEELQANSFGTQQLALDRFCETNGYEVVGSYKEYVSASKKVKRPQWQAAIDELADNPELTLISWELTRVSRSLGDWTLIESLLDRLRFTDSGDKPLTLSELSMRLVFGQWESIKISERVKAGISRKKNEMERAGLQFTWGNAHNITNEQRKAGQKTNVDRANEHQDRLRRAIEPVKNETLERIADYLNSNTRMRTRRGKKWTIQNLHRALNR